MTDRYGSLQPEDSGSRSPGPTTGGAVRGRVRWLVLWCGLAAGVAVVAFVLGGLVRSPWEDAVANSTALPTTSAVVTEREFREAGGSADGFVSLGDEITIAVPETSSARAVVTSVDVAPDEMVRYGAPLVTVSGRPLIVLALEIPLYRDLAPGMSGPDVESLQRALDALGYYSGYVDGRYESGTADAVERLYSENDLEPPAGVPFSTVGASPDAAVDESSAVVQGESPESGSLTSTSDPLGSPSAGTSTPVTGTPLPMAEVVDVPGGGARVASIADLGEVLEGDDIVAKLRIGEPHVTARVGVADAEAFQPGSSVTVATAGNEPVEVQVARISEFRSSDSDGRIPGYDIRVPLPEELMQGAEGAAATVMPTGHGEVATSLAVPLVALREDADGMYVLKAGDGQKVTVQLGLQSDGYAQILGDTSLEPGDEIIIGGPGE